MKSKIRHMFTGVVIAAIMSVFLPVWTLTSYAADGRIAFSDETASVGSEIEVKLKVTSTEALSNATIMLSYDSSMLEFLSGTGASGGAGSIRVTVGGDTADAKVLASELKFKAVQAGTSKISVNTEEVYDAANQVVNITKLGTSTITVQAPANASKEAALADLKVSPGTLTPEFSPEVFAYTADVEEDVTKISVNAPAKDEKASVVLSGNEDLQPGENKVVCRVVAEDGATVKEYVITVNRAGDGSAGAPLDGSLAVETPAKTVTIIPLDEGVTIPAGFAECTIKIDGQDVQGWIWATDTEHKYCVFYGMNEAGEKDFYRYDLAEKTMQRYFQDPAIETNVTMEEYAALAEEHNSLLEDYKLRMYIIVGLGVVAVLLFIIMLILLASRRRGHDDDDDDDEYTNYEEKLNDRKESVRRASEGLPSQRAKAQAERMTPEQRQAQEVRRMQEEQELERRRAAQQRQDPDGEQPGKARVPSSGGNPESADRPESSAAGDRGVDPRSGAAFAQGATTTFVPKPIVSIAAVQRPQAAGQSKDKADQQKETRQERLARQAEARAARQAEEGPGQAERRAARRSEARAARQAEAESVRQPEGRAAKKRAARQAEAEAMRQQDLWGDLQSEEETLEDMEVKPSRQAERRAARRAEAEARAARQAEAEERAARQAEAEERAARQAEAEAEARAARLAEAEARAARLAEEEARLLEEERARQERMQRRRSEPGPDWEAEARSMWEAEPEAVEQKADRYVWPTVSEPLWQPEPEAAQSRQSGRYQADEDDDDGFEIIDLD